MTFNKIVFAICFAFLLLTGCECECADNSGYIKLRLTRNGQNAVYGPNAFISKDSIRSFIITSFDYEEYVDFLDTFQSIGLYIREGYPLVLEINNIRADTFSVTTEVTDTRGCCDEFHVTSVLRNGQIICTGGCEELIEVGI